MPSGGRRLTTPEMDEFILAHHRGTSHRELTEAVNARFGTGLTVSQIKAYCSRNHLRNGLDTRFKKGQIPHNKGKAWAEFIPPESQERCRATQYRKGHKPHNGGAPVGTVRLRKSGANGKPCYYRKVAEPGKWVPEHRAVWEERNGPVPDGMVVAFANGDTTDCRIENLALETRAERMVRNHMGIRSADAGTERAANAVADLILAAARRGKEGASGKRPKGGG